MSDIFQGSLITTLHDLGQIECGRLEALLEQACSAFKIGLVLPVTAEDMRAEPFARIVHELKETTYIDQIVVTLGRAPNLDDYCRARETVAPLGDRAQVLWTDGPRVQTLYKSLIDAGLNLSVPGKGRQVWTAFGYLLADPHLKAFVLHDCDIVNYQREMLARLCLPIVHPSLDFEFCKAYYARVTDRMYGRVARLLVIPVVRALISVMGHHHFLDYLNGFRYPLSGEFALSASLARSNRIPSDWGLEIGTLAEVFRNTSLKRVCQVDLCAQYEHKHQGLSLDDPNQGLMKMATDVLTSIFRTLASMGVTLQRENYTTLRSAYLRSAQDAIRQYHADALINGLQYDRHVEEQAIEGFEQRIKASAEAVQEAPTGAEAIPNWTRVLAAFPDFPLRLREAVRADSAKNANPPDSNSKHLSAV